MLDILKDYFFSRTSKDSSVLFAGTIISTILNLAIVVLLTRSLSTSDFGIFITALTFTQLITDMLELGVNPATLNFLSSRSESASLVKTSFNLKVGIGLLSGLLVFLLADYISILVFKNEAISPFIKASSVGIFLGMLVTWGQTVFQAQKRFPLASLVNLSPNLVRFVTILLIIFLGASNAFNLFLYYQVVLIFSVVLILVSLGLNFLKSKHAEVSHKQMLMFGLPVGLSFMVAALYTRLDQMFIFNLAGNSEAGVYGLAARLTTVFIFLVASVNSAIVPRFASVSKMDFSTYFKKVIHVSYFISGVGLAAILFSPVIPLIFGTQKFEGSILPFQILMVGIIFFTLSFPYSSAILYRLKKTAFPFWLSVFSLIVIWVLLTILIPQYRSVGAAISVSLVYIVQFIISFIYFNFFLDEIAV